MSGRYKPAKVLPMGVHVRWMVQEALFLAIVGQYLIRELGNRPVS